MKVEIKQKRIAFTNKEWAARMALFLGGSALVAVALALSGYQFPDWQYIYLFMSYPFFYVFLRLHAHITKVATLRQENERKWERL